MNGRKGRKGLGSEVPLSNGERIDWSEYRALIVISVIYYVNFSE